MSLSQSDPPGMEPLVRARHLTFGFTSGVTVFADVDISVASGESVAIMGRSGSGKSTLLQVLSGLISPQQGTVELAGKPFSALGSGKRSDVRLRRLGLVFQFGELVPELTLLENVELPSLFLGCSRREARDAARAALAAVGVECLAKRFVHQVSGGEQQRAAIARALVNRPAVVLADEPTGALDEDNAEQVLDLLLSVATSDGGGLVVVTHSADVAGRCDRVLRMSAGALAEGEPSR